MSSLKSNNAGAAAATAEGTIGGEGDGEVVDAPLVFQCKICLRIVGDTFAWAGSDSERKTVTLHGESEEEEVGNIHMCASFLL